MAVALNIKDKESPDWIQHFAFKVESMEVLLKAKQELIAKGIEVLGPTNHDDFISSIYFFDPSGHRLELTADTCDTSMHPIFAAEAPKVLELWNETHDWSQREKIFGSQSGYKRD
jgi:hypothetical protein